MIHSNYLTLLSSMTVLRDSIHIGSMSPSSTIHLGLSVGMLARSRIMLENNPAAHDTMLINWTKKFIFNGGAAYKICLGWKLVKTRSLITEHGLATGRAVPSLTIYPHAPIQGRWCTVKPWAWKRFEVYTPTVEQGRETARAMQIEIGLKLVCTERISHGLGSISHARNIRIITIPNQKATICQTIERAKDWKQMSKT